MDDVEAAELAALRERAYGSGNQGMSEADGRRLHELEAHSRALARATAEAVAVRDGGRNGSANEQPGAVAPAAVGSASTPAATSAEDGGPASPDSAAVGAPAGAAGPEPRPALSAAAKLLLVIAAALVPVAAITGFLAASAFAEAPADPTATPLVMAEDVDLALRERQRTEVLAFQDWDGGDVTFWGAVDDVSLWWGTADGATCVVVTLDDGGSVPICADTAAARERGIREELELFHVESTAPEAEGLIDVTDVPSTRVVFVGNPYTGQFILLRDD